MNRFRTDFHLGVAKSRPPCRASFARARGSVPAPPLPGRWKPEPERCDAHLLDLQSSTTQPRIATPTSCRILFLFALTRTVARRCWISSGVICERFCWLPRPLRPALPTGCPQDRCFPHGKRTRRPAPWYEFHYGVCCCVQYKNGQSTIVVARELTLCAPTGLARIGSSDVIVKMSNRLVLCGDDPVHQVADGQHAQDAVTFQNRQVPDPP